MNPQQGEVETWILKAAKISVKERIERQNYLISYIGGKVMLGIMNDESSKDYKKKNMIQNNQKQWGNMH